LTQQIANILIVVDDQYVIRFFHTRLIAYFLANNPGVLFPDCFPARVETRGRNSTRGKTHWRNPAPFKWGHGITSINSQSAESNHMSIPSPVPPLMVLKDLVKRYPTSSGTLCALKGINLAVQAGEFVAVVGKSGSGKSTLLNLVSGIDGVSSGEVWIDAAPVHRMTQSQLATWRGKNMGVVFQFFQLLPTLTVAENVMLPMDFCNTWPGRERRARALALLAKLGIAEQADKLPSALSGGQQQRAAIARALANDPPILVADEPTGNLDSDTTIEIMQLFARLVADGKTVLMVTHERDFSPYFTRTITLVDGAIAAAPSAVHAGGQVQHA
jgi:putative ABC transport system ATP-binding protein